MSKKPADIRFFIQVRTDDQRFYGLEFLLQRFCARAARPVVKNKPGAFSSELCGDGGADSARSARDHNNFASESGFHSAEILHFFMAAPYVEAARYRACASRRACIRSARLLDGCALSDLH